MFLFKQNILHDIAYTIMEYFGDIFPWRKMGEKAKDTDRQTYRKTERRKVVLLVLLLLNFIVHPEVQ